MGKRKLVYVTYSYPCRNDIGKYFMSDIYKLKVDIRTNEMIINKKENCQSYNINLYNGPVLSNEKLCKLLFDDYNPKYLGEEINFNLSGGCNSEDNIITVLSDGPIVKSTYTGVGRQFAKSLSQAIVNYCDNFLFSMIDFRNYE